MITSPTPSRRVQFGSLIALILLSTCGCQSRSPDAEGPNPAAIQKEAGESDLPPATFVIEPGPEAQKHAQEALILAQDGDVIEFTAGTFDFDGTLTADGIKNVTVRGKGMEQTVLNFSKVKAGKGGEGIKVKADNFVIQDLTLEDTPGDAIKLQDCNGLILRRVKTWWTSGPSSENGAYGIYPVLSNNVLIEHCVASGASDAGIYVGQSKQVIVRHCHAEENVAGIEIENCVGADVYQNEATNNTGGVLVFSLPGLTIKNGSRCRIFDNKILSNNHKNFAVPGAMVSTVPAGTGVMIMANDEVEVFNNSFDGNAGASCLIVSFLTSQRKFDDPQYDPYSESIHIHGNSFIGGGTAPKGEFLQMYTQATGNRLPDIVYDGIADAGKLVDGKLPAKLGLSIHDNGTATYVNLDLSKVMAGEAPQMSQDLTPFSQPHDPIEAVKLSIPQ